VSVSPRDDVLVFLDLETTGLDPTDEFILEIGMLIVDSKTLEPVGKEPEFSHVVRPLNGEHPTKLWEPLLQWVDLDFLKARSDEVVREMHHKNKLWNELEMGYSLNIALSHAINWLLRELDRGRENPWQPLMMAGNGIDRFDRPFLKQSDRGRQLDSLFHYRSLDISAVRQGLKMAGLKVPEQEGGIAHRALEDCKSERDDWRTLVNFLTPFQEI
jgi:oligoribonuclease (3'-5' exoribonuclease)